MCEDSKASIVKSEMKQQMAALVQKYARTLGKTPKALRVKVAKDKRVSIDTADLSQLQINSLLMQGSGSAGWATQRHLMNQTINSVPKKKDRPDEIGMNGAIETMAELNPENTIEAMLNLQIISLHNLSMEMVSDIANPNSDLFGSRDQQLKHLKSLMTLFNKSVALRHKITKAEQRIQVQHVHVSDGGQAVIGNVESKARC